jgi:hypothetical protein
MLSKLPRRYSALVPLIGRTGHSACTSVCANSAKLLRGVKLAFKCLAGLEACLEAGNDGQQNEDLGTGEGVIYYLSQCNDRGR